MPSLLEVQQALRRGLLDDDDRDAVDLIAGAGLAPRRRLGVYRHTIFATLAKALRLSYPAVHALVGEAFFDGAARIFARANPPPAADLNAYGAGFADFLEGFEPAATIAYLADVARLEWAVNRALHAPDLPALDLRRLASLAPHAHDRVCFTAHPSVSVLRSNQPVDAIRQAVLEQDDAALAAIDLTAGPVHLVVQRENDRVLVERVGAAAWHFVAALLAGERLGAALEAVAADDAPALLAQQLLAGRFTAFRLEGAAP